MGMFDEIKYEYILPLETNDEIKKLISNVEDLTFQTKDLDNCLNLYFINKNGRLIYKNVKYKWVDDDNAFLKGYMDEESHTLEDMNYHGDLIFYSYDSFDQNDGTQLSLLLDYKARFTNGKLETVNLEKYKLQDTTERKENLNKMLKESNKHKKIWYNRYFLNTKVYCNLIRRPLLTFFRKLNNLTQNLYYFISRYI